jgi:uncharacterized membrane protein
MMVARAGFIAIAAASLAGMLYVGAYQIRLVEHLACPLVKRHSCEAVADAPFARPFGIPDGFIAAALYGVLIGLALLNSRFAPVHYGLRALAVVAAIVNFLGVHDMSRLGAWCFYCVSTTVLSIPLVWLAFLF